MTESIEALAEKAVEARNAYKIGSGKPDTEDRLWHAHRNAMEAFRSRATPEAWLALTVRNRELEGRDALRDRTSLEYESHIAELEEALKEAREEIQEMEELMKYLPTSKELDPW